METLKTLPSLFDMSRLLSKLHTIYLGLPNGLHTIYLGGYLKLSKV
jgi:hypothetical protein